MSSSPLSPEETALRTRIHDALVVPIRKCVLPIVYATQFRFESLGSCVLFAIGDMHFALTAGHVIHELVKQHQKYAVYIPTNKPGAPFIRLGKLRVHASPMDNSSPQAPDLVDMGYIVLEQDVVDALSPDMHFLRFGETDVLDQFDAKSLYVTFGYPEIDIHTSKNTQQVIFVPMEVISRVYQHTRGSLVAYDPKLSIALDYHESLGKSASGEVVGHKDPHGMSGCGIWRIWKDSAHADTWTADDVRLVAIQHTWNFVSGALIGTKIGVTANDIITRFPELKKIVNSTLFFTKHPQ